MLTHGLHPRMVAEDYHRRELGVASKSALSELARSPLHYRAWVDGQVPDEDTDALAFGRALHHAILEPDIYAARYTVAPDFGDCRANKATGTTKEEGAANKAARDAWRQQNAGKEMLTDDDADAIKAMAAAVLSHPLASKMLVGGQAETTLVWPDEETGLTCKCRSDYYVPGRKLVVDLKSSKDASPKAFGRDVFKYGYHWQHAFYRSGFAALKIDVSHFVFVVVEKEPPYAVATYTLDDAAVAIAYDQVRSLVRTLRDCMTTDVWPGYPVAIRTLDTPKWMTAA